MKRSALLLSALAILLILRITREKSTDPPQNNPVLTCDTPDCLKQEELLACDDWGCFKPDQVLACSTPDCFKDQTLACFTPDCLKQDEFLAACTRRRCQKDKEIMDVPARAPEPPSTEGYIPSAAISAVVRRDIELQSMEREVRLKPSYQVLWCDGCGVARRPLLWRNDREPRLNISGHELASDEI